MQFRGASIVGIASRNDATSARTAGTRSNKHIREANTLFGYPVNVGRAYSSVSIATYVIPAHVIGYNENDVWSLLRVGNVNQQNQQKEK